MTTIINIQKLNDHKYDSKKTKKDLYSTERLDVLNKLNKIININDDNKIINPYNLDNDIEIQNQIFSLIPDIKKFFKYGAFPYFCRKEYNNRQYLSLIKSIYKDMGFNIVSTQKSILIDGVKKVGLIYVVVK